jgi:hypothetical protein
MTLPPRIDAQVANIVAAADVLHEAVMQENELVLNTAQLFDLQRAQFKIAHILYAEMGDPPSDGDDEGTEEGMDAPSLTSDEEQARLEGEQRDEMNELPSP